MSLLPGDLPVYAYSMLCNPRTTSRSLHILTCICSFVMLSWPCPLSVSLFAMVHAMYMHCSITRRPSARYEACAVSRTSPPMEPF